MAIRIEKLTPARIEAALQVFRDILGTTLPLTFEEILERLNTQRGIFYIAVDIATGQVIGLKFGFIQDQTCIGRGVAVLPAYRRQGIATRLLRRFERDLAAQPNVKSYAFGSGTLEGIPFHMTSGYQPQLLIQFSDPQLRKTLELAYLTITNEGYHSTYQVYQIYATLEPGQSNLEHLRLMQERYPQTSVQFFFFKDVAALRETVTLNGQEIAHDSI